MVYCNEVLGIPFDYLSRDGVTPFACGALSNSRQMLVELINLGCEPTKQEMSDFDFLFRENEVVEFRSLLVSRSQVTQHNMHAFLRPPQSPPPPSPPQSPPPQPSPSPASLSRRSSEESFVEGDGGTDVDAFLAQYDQDGKSNKSPRY